MAIKRQTSENWLDPISRSRVTCHNITWGGPAELECLHAGSDIYFDRLPATGTMPHMHDFLEILLVNSGGVTHRVNGERQLLTAGDICFLRPDDAHSFAPHRAFRQVEIVMLDFDLELALALSVYLGYDAFLQRLTEPVLPACFKTDPAATASLYGRLLKLNSPATGARNRSVRLRLLLGELYVQFFVDDTSLLREARAPAWLETLCAAMRQKENFTAGLPRMLELAQRTQGHLCKAFRKHLHTTPTAFINGLRLNHAAWMLSDTRMPIIDIAEELGFLSLSRFYHLFRKAHGASPAAYRRTRRALAR